MYLVLVFEIMFSTTFYFRYVILMIISDILSFLDKPRKLTTIGFYFWEIISRDLNISLYK